MAINLTEGAIASIFRGDVTTDNHLMPVLQVMELKLVVSKQQQHQQQQQQRFRLVLSDGLLTQQGMLATQRNELVTSGLLQIGSIVRLTKFTCNVIQNRMIVIVMDLEVIIDKCDPIGKPIPAQKPSLVSAHTSNDQSGSVTGNPQSFGGPVDKSSVRETSLQHHNSRMNQCTSYPNNSDLARYGATNTPPNYFKPDLGTGSESSTDQKMSFCNARPELPRPYGINHAYAAQPAYLQPSSMYTNNGPVAKNETPSRIIPIAALNPYQGNWTIKARVTSKGELRNYNNQRGDGKVFHFDLLDSDGGEIRVTCFNAVADQFYHQVETGKIYLISKGTLKPAQKNFNHLQNDLEIFLETTSMIQPCFEDDNSIAQQQFHFRPISDIEVMKNNCVVDIIGVVSSISPAASIMRKNGTETQKRTLLLIDMSGRSVELTLWGNFCSNDGQRLQQMCDSGVFPVLAVKASRVSDFNGKAVGTISSSQLFIEPDFPEAHRLKDWFDKEGKNTKSVSISKESLSVGRMDIRKTISQIKDEGLGTKEKPDWITVSATIVYIKFDNFCYTACPVMIGDRPCNKKVMNNGDGRWHCDRCDQSIVECDYRYILQFQIQDHTGLTWVTAFQECGEEILGISAKDLYYLKYVNQNDEKFSEILGNAAFTKYLFKLKVKEETFSDEQRVKSTVLKVERYNHSSETRVLLDLMDRLKCSDSCNTLKAESIIPNPGMIDFGKGNIGIRQTAPTVANYVGNNNNACTEFGLLAYQTGQYRNHYNGSSLPEAGTSAMHQVHGCYGATGHSSINFRSIMSGPGQTTEGGHVNRVFAGSGVAASDECYKCHKNGHWARDCPGMNAASPAHRSSSIGIPPARYGGYPSQQVGGF